MLALMPRGGRSPRGGGLGALSRLLVPWLLALTSFAQAADWKPIQGTFAITAAAYLDPTDTERKDSHIRFQLKGRSARDLFAAMKAAPTKDECTGGVAKRVGDMQCVQFKEQGRYECSFSIDIVKQKIEYGVAC